MAGTWCSIGGWPPLLEAFCRFHLGTGARQVILTYLNDFGRDANDYWDDAHVQLVRTEFREMSPNASFHIYSWEIMLYFETC